MNIWFSSDPHYWHRNILKYCPERKFACVEEMNQALIDNWNAKVQPEDLVYELGDIFFCNNRLAREINKQRNGHKILVQGNHDKFRESEYLSLGYDMVARKLNFKYDGIFFQMCHYPYAPSKEVQAELIASGKGKELRYLDRRPEDRGGWLLHGHVHQHWKQKGRQINVGVDVWGLAPVHLDQILEIVKNGAGTIE